MSEVRASAEKVLDAIGKAINESTPVSRVSNESGQMLATVGVAYAILDLADAVRECARGIRQNV